jgi:hypothetical protein
LYRPLNLISSRLGLDNDRVSGDPNAFQVMSRFLQQNGGDLTDYHPDNTEGTKSSGLAFRALLSGSGAERLELARV